MDALEHSARIVARRIAQARRVVVLTGSGVSAESGIATFRGSGGHWKMYRAQDLASVAGFLEKPEVVWEWYCERIAAALAATPNLGHRALAELERRCENFALITQNVDGLHQRAGSSNVIELHGTFHRFRCLDCQEPFDSLDDCEGRDVPTCAKCGGLVRPSVVWFGESLPEEPLAAAMTAARSSDVFLSVGTSSVVYPAAQLPLDAQSHGAFLVEINTEHTPLTPKVDVHLAGPASRALPLILELFEGTAE